MCGSYIVVCYRIRYGSGPGELQVPGGGRFQVQWLHWRRIIRTASASGLSAQWSPVQGQGRNSQLFSAILPTSHYWSALKRTRTFSDNIKGTYARPGSVAV